MSDPVQFNTHGLSEEKWTINSKNPTCGSELSSSKLSFTSAESDSLNDSSLGSENFVVVGGESEAPESTHDGRFVGCVVSDRSIGIVGMSCRFPGGVASPSDFWKLMMEGRITSKNVPFDRWDAHAQAAKSNLNKKQKKQVSYGSFVDDFECFDSSFFNISKLEANSMSPVQRALLECSYMALLDAGYASFSEMKGLNCGVFVGIWGSANSTEGRPTNNGKPVNDGSVYSVYGSSPSIAAGRISYVFDFHGPNGVYDTACSSSFVALDAAIAALQMGKCDVALVAGANELFDPRVFERAARAGMLSPTGHCNTFDASADGYLRGEGCGVVVIKRDSSAAPGTVYANLLGSCVMSDGNKAAITAPNPSAQRELIRQTHKICGISPGEVDYVEAHGTGTPLGDPIELEALSEVVAKSKDRSSPLVVGSVKGNIGHLEGAAGIAGLIKAVLVLVHEMVPPNAGLKKLNPFIEKRVAACDVPIVFPTGEMSLQNRGDTRLLTAGVSSFGYSGVISHAVVQQASKNMRRGLHHAELGDLALIFPGRARLPWPETPPHPLLQQCLLQSSSAEFRTVFHERLVTSYSDRAIVGRSLFPSAGYIEMGIAAGEMMGEKGVARGIELLNVNFKSPFYLEPEQKMISHHIFGSGMEFKAKSANNEEVVLTSIEKIHKKSLAPNQKSLSDLEFSHTRDLFVSGGMFDCLRSASSSEDGKSVMGQVLLEGKPANEYDGYFCVHPVVIEGAFQLMSLLCHSEKQDFMIAGVSRVSIYREGNLVAIKGEVTAYAELIDNGPNVKTGNIEVFDERGLLMTLQGVRYIESGCSTSEKLGIERFLALGENRAKDIDAAEEAKAFMAHTLVRYLNNNEFALSKYPWLKSVLQHAEKDSPDAPLGFRRELYNRSEIYRVAVDIYNDIPRLLENPLRVVSSHPDHDKLYENGGYASSGWELSSLLHLVCKEWHGTKLRVFEVGTGSGGLTRRAVPVLDDHLEKYVCSDVFDMRIGLSLRNHPAISNVKHDVNNELIGDEKYHLILAANAIHVASNVVESLKKLSAALEDGGMLLLEELVSTDALYIHGLDKFIWETPKDSRSYGLWMSWEEWLEAIDAVEGLDLIVWHRNSRFVSMLLRKSSARETVRPSVTNDVKILKEKLNKGCSMVYSGDNADDVVKSLTIEHGKIPLKSLQYLDSSSYELPDGFSPPLKFNAMKMGKLGTTISMLHGHGGDVVPVKDNALRTGGTWEKSAIASEVKEVIRSLANSDHHGFESKHSLVEVGLNSLATTELVTELSSRFNVELPSARVLASYSVSEVIEHVCQSLGSVKGEVNSGEFEELAPEPYDSWDRKKIAALVEEFVLAFADTKGVDDLEHSASLMGEVGLNSIDLVELSSRIVSRFQVEVPSTIVYNHPSISDITDYLVHQLGLEDNGANDESQRETKGSDNDVAVVGMSCRFPGGITNPSKYWEFLCSGKVCSGPIPFGRWDSHSLVSQSHFTETEKMQVSSGSFVEDIESFDPSFFNISKAEAESMSPLQRMLLECSYLALLDAGYTSDEMKGLNCGVFLGSSVSMNASGRPSNSPSRKRKTVYGATGSAVSMAAGRISYVFDFHGPNGVYDTACSSSLVALDAAITALQMGKCDMALVAGANELFDSDLFEELAISGMLSPTGYCHTWDASADGYLRGEGCGVIVLKPTAGTKPGSVYATLRGTCIMSDGKSVCLTAPNGSSQEMLIRQALKVSGVKPNEVDYIEAHGTGTPLGDPIEVEALSDVFGKSKSQSQPLLVGSVKSNIGHLEGAAGIAGLIKAVLVLMHQLAPANVGLKELNPLIKKTLQLCNNSISFPTEEVSLGNRENRRLLTAGVSSFGFSGTIAHAIIQQAPINVRRVLDRESKKSSSKILFLFTGQGSQYEGMGEALYRENAQFRNSMDRCEHIYQSLTGGDSLLDMIFSKEENHLLSMNTQPALVALEWSLVKMWQSKKVVPEILVGHSLGEISAACAAGAMSIDVALELAIIRGRLCNKVSHTDGAMVSVRSDADTVMSVLSSGLNEDERRLVGLACVNGPNSVVVSGASDVVEKVLLKLGKKGVSLQVTNAFHSPLMSEIEDEFRSAISSLDILNPLSTSIASTVTGEMIRSGETIEVEHWVKQLSSPVLFHKAFALAANDGDNARPRRCMIFEVGPKAVLSPLAKSWHKTNDLWMNSTDTLSNSIYFPEDELDLVFPNRLLLPWPETPPHPLLQKCFLQSSSAEFHTVFHKRLITSYIDHAIAGRSLFPGAGYIEMGIAAGAMMGERGLAGGIELLNVNFKSPFYLEHDQKMISHHIFGSGMEFKTSLPAGEEVVVASIELVRKVPLIPNQKALSDLWHGFNHKAVDIQSYYAQVVSDGVLPSRGMFQCLVSAFLSEDRRSALGHIALPEGFKLDHDDFYWAHPVIVDGTFQLLYLMCQLDEVWVPAGVSRVAMYREGNLIDCRRKITAHVRLVDDGPRLKSCDIEIFDEEGALMSLSGFRIARFRRVETDVSVFTTNWVEYEEMRVSDDLGDCYSGKQNLAIVQLRSCGPTTLFGSDQASSISVSDIESMNAQDIPSTLVVPVSFVHESAKADECHLIEDCIFFLKALVSSVRGSSDRKSRKICFLTRNATGPWIDNFEDQESKSKATEMSRLFGGSIWGMVRSAALELDPVLFQLMCIDTDVPLDEKQIFNDILNDINATSDVEIAYRGNKRYVRRLEESKNPILGDVEVKLDDRGSLQNLSVVSSSGTSDMPLPSDCVQVAVHAVGLNFKDVLNVLVPNEAGYLGVDTPPLPGSEFAGVVIGVPNSECEDCGFNIGDKVYGLGDDLLRSKKNVSIHSIAKVPSGISLDDAAALPIAFLTVLHALKVQANLKHGQRILIHSAAGGVGLAAVQYAKLVGAEIYATASPSKHDHLRSVGLTNLSTSRDADVFKNEMGRLLAHKRFDVILSAGNLVDESLEFLDIGGCFLELGKRNILAIEEMAERRPDVKYFTHTLNELRHEKPKEIHGMLRQLADYVECGKLTPLRTEVFGFQSGLIDGFKRLRDGVNIGKMVIRLQRENDVGTVIITGGLGGLGLVTAEKMLELGAEHVVLVSRSGKPKHYDGQNLKDRLRGLLSSYGKGRLSIECCDVSKEHEVISLLHHVREKHGSINTIVHASGVLSDSWLHNMESESVKFSFGPKAAGAWYLHENTPNDDIRNFILFSSTAALIGNQGQTNYSASNSFLDSLAQIRRSQGLPGISIHWPAIAEVGMAAANHETVNSSPDEQLRLNEVKLFLHQIFFVGDGNDETVISPIPGGLMRKLQSQTRHLPLVSGIAPRTVNGLPSHQYNAEMISTVAEISTMEVVVTCVERVLGEPIDDPEANLLEAGMDSLASTELLKHLGEVFPNIDFPPTVLFDYPTIGGICDMISLNKPKGKAN